MMYWSRAGATMVAVILVASTAVAASLASAASAEVTYTPTLGGQVVASGNPQDAIFFGDVLREGAAEDDDDDNDYEGEDDEVIVQASCGGRLSKPGGGKRSPRGNRRAKDMAEDNYRQARRYGDEVRVILIGDSIINNLEDRRGCEKRIFKRFGGKGFNWGIGGAKSDFVEQMVAWIFRNHDDLRPQVVYLAVGVNDCRAGRDEDDIADNIIDTIRTIKYYSPDTQVVVQGILPTAYPEDDADDFEGEEFEDFKLYDCIRDVNKEVKKWARKYRSRCITYNDADDVVLDDDEFKEDVLKDGLHFATSEMNDYCKEIERAVKRYRKQKVSANGEFNVFTNWTDAEPLHYPDVEGNVTLFRWRYNSWSNCTGACGMQRRTAECHRVDAHTGEGYTVQEGLCSNSFLNPLERVCNLRAECQGELGPLGALLHQPIPAHLVPNVTIDSEARGECGGDGLTVMYLSLTLALAAALLAAVAALAYTCVTRRHWTSRDLSPALQDLKLAAAMKQESGLRPHDVNI